jgi:hypothetical protein
MPDMKSLTSSLVPRVLCSLIGFSMSLPTARAHAQVGATSAGGLAAVSPSADTFGTTGQWVYSLSDPSEFPFILNKTGGGPWHLLIQPSADTFIAPSVSVGGLLKFERAGGNTTVGVGARAGYDLRLTSLVSLWIRGGLFYQHFSPAMGPSASQTFLDVKIPALFHLVPHFFVGVGPTLTVVLQGVGDTTIGLSAIVGGYL